MSSDDNSTKRRDESIETPERAISISDVKKFTTSDNLSESTILLMTPSGVRRMGIQELLKQFSPLIGTYVNCASNVYDYNNIVPCLGAEIYAEDFVDGLDLLSSRMPNFLKRTEENGIVMSLQLPDLRDRVLQFDPSLRYGEFEDEGIENDFVSQFDIIDFDETINMNESSKSVNVSTGGGSFSGTSDPFYACGSTASYVTGATRVQSYGQTSTGYYYVYVDNKTTLSNFLDWTSPIRKTISFSGNVGRKTTSISVPTYSLSKSIKSTPKALNKKQINIGSRTRERTVNVFTGIYTGLLKKSNKKKFWILSNDNRVMAGSEIYLLASTKNRGKYVGENPTIMIGEEPDHLSSSMLFIEAGTAKTFYDQLGILINANKDHRGAAIKLEDYFSELSRTYLVDDEKKIVFSSDGKLLVISASHNGLNYSLKIPMDIEVTKAKDKEITGTIEELTSISVDYGTGSSTSVTTPPIMCTYTISKDILSVFIRYKVQKTDDDNRSIGDSIFWSLLKDKGASEENIKKLKTAFPALGVINIDSLENDETANTFYFKVTNDKYKAINDNENIKDQKQLATEFEQGVSEKTEEHDLYNAFKTDKQSELSTFIDFDKNQFMIEGLKVELISTLHKDEEHRALGFKSTDTSKDYSLMITGLTDPVVDENGTIMINKVSSSVATLKYNFSNDSKICIYKGNIEDGNKYEMDILKGDFNSDKVPIFMIAYKKVLMISIPLWDPKKVKDAIHSGWSSNDAKNITHQECKDAMEVIPFNLGNTSSVDNIDDGHDLMKTLFSKGYSDFKQGSWTRFYFRLK